MCIFTLLIYDLFQGRTNFSKSRSHVKIVGPNMVTRCKFCTEGLQILGITVLNLVARRPGARDLYASCLFKDVVNNCHFKSSNDGEINGE